jgi:hypothetical protein
VPNGSQRINGVASHPAQVCACVFQLSISSLLLQLFDLMAWGASRLPAPDPFQISDQPLAALSSNGSISTRQNFRIVLSIGRTCSQ